MLITVFQIIFIAGIIGILVIIFRKIPIILRYPREPFEEVSIVGLLERVRQKITSNEFFHGIALPKTEKFLRKIKIFVLKLDNFLTKMVSKLRHKRHVIEEENNTEFENDDTNLPSMPS
jgi:hypothetical protein